MILDYFIDLSVCYALNLNTMIAGISFPRCFVSGYSILVYNKQSLPLRPPCALQWPAVDGLKK